MPKKSMETLTESMFYVLLAFTRGPLCGTDASELIEKVSEGRVCIGPATLYTLLAKFEKEKYIKEISVEGRRRTYEMTEKGLKACQSELERLYLCIKDAQAMGQRRTCDEER